ncbi:MAG: ABC transporter ATP-binding protein/permease [Aquiluna sp.]|nr:ABC transporter ATP-binding protein/permease [Aquiluna sp.]MCF8546223.1 ABC transporter ATP-binding protein/permease [Aquiluna sp.]
MSDYQQDPTQNPKSREYKGPRAKLKDLLPYLADHRKALTLALILSVVASALSLAQPLLMGQVIAAVEASEEFTLIAIGIVVLILVGALVNGFQYFLLYKTGEGVVLSTRKSLVARMLRLPIPEYDRRRIGDMVSRVGSDSTLLRAVLTQGLVDALGGLLQFTGAVVVMAFIDPVLLGSTLGVVFLAIIAIAITGRRIRSATTKAQQKVGAMSASVERALGAIRTIRAARAEGRETEEIYKDATAAYDQGVKIAKLSAVVAPIAQIAFNTAFIVVLGLGGLRVATGATSIASLVTFVILLFFMVGPLISAFGAYSSVMGALGALARIQEIMIIPEEKTGEAQSLREPVNEIALEFQELSFHYAPSEDEEPKQILNSVNLQIPRGSRVALVGPSGAGKSTIFSLIERFYEPTSGEILLDGQRVTDFSRASLREQIGYVEQDAPVLAGSLKDNLLLGKADATDAELTAVLGQVNLSEVLARDPKGLDAEVGENGIMLSGGERQRLAIARALLAAPAILLLDESTSALDGPNEQRMREAIDAVAKNRTLVVIAHRLSTVVDSDQIIVLENGQVVGTGTHSELVKSTPLYAELAKHQLLV